jgi:hypothetical protein
MVERNGISGARRVVRANAKWKCRNRMDSSVVAACMAAAMSGVEASCLDGLVDDGDRVLEK